MKALHDATKAERGILVALLLLETPNAQGYYTITTRTLAETLKLYKTNASDAIKGLADGGYLEIIADKRQSRGVAIVRVRRSDEPPTELATYEDYGAAPGARRERRRTRGKTQTTNRADGLPEISNRDGGTATSVACGPTQQTIYGSRRVRQQRKVRRYAED